MKERFQEWFPTLSGELKFIFSQLQDAGYRHIFLEPLLFYGVAFGTIIFGLGLGTKQRRLQLYGLILMVGSSLSVVPFLSSLGSSREAILSSYNGMYAAYHGAMEKHLDFREQTKWVYFLLSVFGVFTYIFAPKKNFYRLFMGGTTLLLGVGVVLFGIWMNIHYADVFYHYRLPKAQKVMIMPIENRAPVRLEIS